jgi:hypothetical protein
MHFFKGLDAPSLYGVPSLTRASIHIISQSRATNLRHIDLSNANNPVWRPGSYTLRKLLTISQDCLCRDQKDKIYGLLGLADDVNEKDIPIDYSQSIFQLYENVLEFRARQGFGNESALWFSHCLQRALLLPISRARVKDLAEGRRKCMAAREQSLVPINSILVNGFSLGRIMTEDCLLQGGNSEDEHFFEMKYPFNGYPKSPRSMSSSPVALAWRKALNGLWKADKETLNFFDSNVTTNEDSKKLELFPRETPSHGLTAFVTKGHEIGLAPKGIKDTDILCRFPGNNTPGNNFSAIVRAQEHGYEVVGRAIMSKTKLVSTLEGRLEWSLPAFGKLAHEFHADEFSKKEIELEIPVPVVQALTCPLTWKGTRRKGWYDDLECPMSDNLRYWRTVTNLGVDVSESKEGKTLEELAEARVFLI